MTPKLIVFDLDGTLIDSRRDLAESVNAVLRHLSRPGLSEAQISAFIGDGAAMLVRRALGATGPVDPAQVDEAVAFFLAYYREHLLDHTELYPGVLDTLRSIRAQAPAVPMAVLTNKPVGPSRRICDGLGLSPFLSGNYGGDSFTTKKPHPAGLLQVIADASAMGVTITPAETVLVGDSDVDVKTARAAGALSLGCRYGYAPEAMLAAGPDWVVDTASEWPGVLGFH